MLHLFKFFFKFLKTFTHKKLISFNKINLVNILIHSNQFVDNLVISRFVFYDYYFKYSYN